MIGTPSGGHFRREWSSKRTPSHRNRKEAARCRSGYHAAMNRRRSSRPLRLASRSRRFRFESGRPLSWLRALCSQGKTIFLLASTPETDFSTWTKLAKAARAS